MAIDNAAKRRSGAINYPFPPANIPDGIRDAGDLRQEAWAYRDFGLPEVVAEPDPAPAVVVPAYVDHPHEYAALAEIALDAQTLRSSFEGVAPNGQPYYEGDLESIGVISREAPLLPGEMRIGDTVVEYADNKRFSTLRETVAFRNRTATFKFGDAARGYGNLHTVFTGKVSGMELQGGRARLRVRDTAFDKFRNPLETSFNTTLFPLLPAQTPAWLLPIIYGSMVTSSTAFPRLGAVPCFRVEPNAVNNPPYWDYFVARHVCKAITQVYVYGISGYAYTNVVKNVGGTNMQFIRFGFDPKHPERANEIEVTADIQGITNDGTAGGTLLTNPVDQLQHYLLNYAGVVSGDLSSAHWAAANAVASRNSYSGGCWIGWDNVKHADIINNFSTSFMMPFSVTREGKFAVSILVLADVVNQTGIFPELTDENEIFRDSFRMEPNEDVASKVIYRYSLSHVQGKAQSHTIALSTSAGTSYEQTNEWLDNAEAVNLGQAITKEISLPYVRTNATAFSVAQTMGHFMKENQQFARFTLPIEHYQRDLTDTIRLTHFNGPGVNGYRRAKFRIIKLDLDLNPYTQRIDVRAARLPEN